MDPITFPNLSSKDLEKAELVYFGNIIGLRVYRRSANGLSQATFEVEYETSTGKMQIKYTSVDFGDIIQEPTEDHEEKLRIFVRENRDKFQTGLGVLTEEQRGLVKRFLDGLEKKPSRGLLGFLGF